MKKIVIVLIFLGELAANSFAQAPSKIARSSKTARIIDEINISEADVTMFKTVTERKVAELQQHIIIISDKDQPPEKRNLAELEALKLFYKGAMMEVSYIDASGETIIKTRTIENYLYRLKTLPFTKVIIKYYDIAYVTEFIKGPDNKFYDEKRWKIYLGNIKATETKENLASL